MTTAFACGLFDLRLFFQGSLVNGHTRISMVCYITVYMGTAREPAVEVFVTC